MEKSIKRVEKLVHATNSALAQMKYSLMFDDLSDGVESGGGGKPSKKYGPGQKLLDGEDLRLCQDEFRSETQEMLARMEKLFGPKEIPTRKHSKTLERIKEINKKLTSHKFDPPETQQSRQKLQTLISQDLTPASKASADKPPALKLEKASVRKESDRKSPSKSKEDLKSKILETQEVVDRGVQTARELSQKVESIRKMTPSESDAKKSESSETLRSRCGKCAERRRTKKVKKQTEIGECRVKEDNVRVLEVKDARVPSLCIQRLPSLHIKDGLRLQKVHEVEIPSGDSCEKVNTAKVILTHEDIEKEKREKEMDRIRFNCFSDEKSNYVECFNCGKLNKTRETRVDPRRVDDILRMCDFNVFDPRIDEFVERCNMGERIQEEGPVQDRSGEPTVIEKSHRKTRKLQEMSDYLSRLYEQEANALEDNHLRLDNLLQSLFRRVDESREMFEECCLLKRGTHRLTMTKPVTMSVGITRKKMDKKDVKNRSKSRTVSPEEAKPSTSSGFTSEDETNFFLNEKPIETYRKEERDEKEPAMILSSSIVAKPSNLHRKPSITNRKASRAPKKIFRKSVPRTEIQKTAQIPPSIVEALEVEDKSPLSSSSTTSKKAQAFSKVRKPQASDVDNYKQLESKNNKKTLETSKINDVTLSEEQSPPIAKKFTFEPSFGPAFEKPDSPITPSRDLKREKSETSSNPEMLKKPETGAASPKSENNEDYESDFEGESEPEVKPKLSTILEVDSEPEKKETERSQGTTPTELVSSLKEILSALKDQFTRTETLAEKLTENVQEKKDSPKLWPTDSELVINLQSARKDFKNTRTFRSPFSLVDGSRNRKSDDSSSESLSEGEGGSSIGEVVTKRKADSSISENLASGKRSSRVSSARKNAIHLKLRLNNDGSYSEGEIHSNILMDSEADSVRSVGEVASNKTSVSSNII